MTEMVVVPSAPLLKLKRFKDPARYALIATLAAIIVITALGNAQKCLRAKPDILIFKPYRRYPS